MSRSLGAWLVLLAIGAALAAVVTAVPSPHDLFGPSVAAGLSAELDRAALVAAGVLTWLLVAWLAGVLVVAVMARVVLGGRRGRVVVVRATELLVPRALRGIVLTAVGIGSLTGITGCAPGAAADAFGGAAATIPAATGTSMSAPLTVDLDWPLDPSPTSTPASDAASGPTTASLPASAPAPTAAPAPIAVPAPVPSGAPATTIVTEPTLPAAAPADMTAGPSPPAAPTLPAAPADMTAGPSLPAAPTLPAAPAGPAGPAAPTAPTAPDLPGAPAPADPVASASPDDAPADPARTVTVVRGDSLWSIAAAHLPGDASAADIALAWPHWYAANHAVIGDDPGHIEPGWHLTVPSDREDS